MKNIFEAPLLEIVMFDNEDVITTSDDVYNEDNMGEVVPMP